MFGLGVQELIIVGIVAVLLFGKRLPEVAKSLGQSYREFRKGLTEIQSSFDTSDTYRAPTSYPTQSSESVEDYDDYDEPSAPKFEPPPSEPQQAAADAARAGEISGEISKPITEK